jgi:hypothetical protein
MLASKHPSGWTFQGRGHIAADQPGGFDSTSGQLWGQLLHRTGTGMSSNFGGSQLGVYADAVKGVNSRYPFDFRSIERKAAGGGAG